MNPKITSLLALNPHCSANGSLATMLRLACLATGMVLTTIATASAAEYSPNSATSKSKIGINAGVGVMYVESPYDTDDSNFLVLPNLLIDNQKGYVRGSQLGGYLVKDSDNEIAAYLQPAGFEFDPKEAKGALRGLDEREWSGMAGVSYQRRIPYSAVKAQLETDILGHSKGTLAKLSLATKYNTGSLTLYPSLGVEWANDTYNDYYFGVSNKESLKTGVDQYSADSSVTPYLNLTAIYDVNEDWLLSFGQRVSFLPDEQTDSPMVEHSTTYRTTVGVMYKF